MFGIKELENRVAKLEDLGNIAYIGLTSSTGAPLATNHSYNHEVDSKSKIEKIAKEMAELKATIASTEMVTCESCGCAVIKDDAIKGESVVGNKKVQHGCGYYIDKEYVKETFYCKRCAKKRAKQK